jgi:predicted amidohydrolase
MKVHCCQFDVVWEDKQANFAKVRGLLKETRPEPGGLVVLPEMFATGFSLNLAVTREGVMSVTHPFLGDLAREFQVCVLGGFVQGIRGDVFNQAVALSPYRRELSRYSKRHPFSPAGEDQIVTPGHDPALFEWEGFVVAPFICYDLRFPEDFRQAVALGATLLVVMANWPASRVEHWVALLRARAIENQAYVVGVNRCGADPRVTYPGRSLVVDPKGEILADAGPGEGVLSADLQPATVDAWRAEFPALRDARF